MGKLLYSTGLLCSLKTSIFGSIRPASFLGALEQNMASVYKLTTPLTIEYLGRGHGFHFLLPGPDTVFLCVMGKPPRSPSFNQAVAQSNLIDSEWGQIPTIGIRHLVEIKKTQRLADYPIIGKLILCGLRTLSRSSDAGYSWAINNTFALPELKTLLDEFPEVLSGLQDHSVARDNLERLMINDDSDIELECSLEAELTQRILACQQADRAYWRDIICELKLLRSRGEIIPEGTLITGCR